MNNLFINHTTGEIKTFDRSTYLKLRLQSQRDTYLGIIGLVNTRENIRNKIVPLVKLLAYKLGLSLSATRKRIERIRPYLSIVKIHRHWYKNNDSPIGISSILIVLLNWKVVIARVRQTSKYGNWYSTDGTTNLASIKLEAIKKIIPPV